MGVETVGTPLLWAGFVALVLGLLALDLGLFHRKAHAVTIRESAIWSVIWVALSMAFAFWVWRYFGPQQGKEFLTGYLLEKALSVDNLFVFLVLFSTFRVPGEYQHRVLFWGILGALILRAAFIGAGTTLVQNFHWIFYVFGALLIYTGIKLLVQRDEDPEPQNNPLVRLFQRFVPVTAGYRGPHFFSFENGRRYATPLLLVLVAIEASDLVFALDSIPAIFAVTDDPFIVFTSNIFAILGLRSLFFLLAGIMNRFHYLKYGLALILIYVGVKMLLAELHIYKIPIELSLGIIAGLLLGAVLFSLFKPNREPEEERAERPPAEGARD